MKREFVVGLGLVCGVAACNLIPGLGGNTHPKSGPSAPGSSSGGSSASSAPGGAEAPAVAPVVAGGGPTWCPKDYQPSTSDSNVHWVKQYTENGWGEKASYYIAKAACDKPNDKERQKDLAGWIAFYKKEIGGTDRDFTDQMMFAMLPDDESKRLEAETCGDEKHSYTVGQLRGEAEILKVAERELIGCGRSNAGDEMLYWLDVPNITELQRTSLVDGCLPKDVSNEDKVRGEIAYCGTDMRALDRAKFDTELAAMKLNLYGRVNAVETFLSAKSRATATLAKYDALAKKDPDWKRITDAPQQGWQHWMKEYEANKAAFELVKAFDAKTAAGSKKALAGCADDLRAKFFAHLAGTKKVNTVDHAKAAATDLVGYPLLVAFVRCEAATGQYLVASSAVNLFLKHAEARRGPRQEAYAATLTALNDIRNDREKFPLDRLYPEPSRTAYDVWNGAYEQTFNKIQYDTPAVGQVKSVKAKGDMVLFTFKTVSWREEVADQCHDTRKIVRINETGGLEYEQSCTYKTETMTSTEKPVSVPKEFAKGIKPGMMVQLDIDTKNGRVGIPTAVWKDTAKKKFIGMFGVVW